MSEIHVKITEDGYELFRTEQVGRGMRRRIRGMSMKVKSTDEIKASHPMFGLKVNGVLPSGESNDRRTE